MILAALGLTHLSLLLLDTFIAAINHPKGNPS